MKPNFTEDKGKKLATLWLKHEDKAYILAQASENDIKIIDVISALVKFAEEGGALITKGAEIASELDELLAVNMEDYEGSELYHEVGAYIESIIPVEEVNNG